MAKTNKNLQASTISGRTASASRSKRTADSSVSEKSATSPKTNFRAKIIKTSGPTHQQIADRAKEIWRKKGCPAGQDEMNWYEAEAQLKQELAVR